MSARGVAVARRTARTIAFEWHGAIIGVRATDATLLERARAALPASARDTEARVHDAVFTWRAERPDRHGRPRHSVVLRCPTVRHPRLVARTRCADTAATLLVHDAEWRVALCARDHLFVHAAAVAWNGRVILLPGYSHAGKSTLTAALVRAGAVYLSDEYAVLDAEGMVQPFARRLHLRSRVGGPSVDVSVESLGGTSATQPLPVGRVLSLTYQTRSRWRPTPMSRGEMALALFDHTIVGRSRPAHALQRIAAALGPDVLGLRGRRGEADAAARRVLDWAG